MEGSLPCDRRVYEDPPSPRRVRRALEEGRRAGGRYARHRAGDGQVAVRPRQDRCAGRHLVIRSRTEPLPDNGETAGHPGRGGTWCRGWRRCCDRGRRILRTSSTPPHDPHVTPEVIPSPGAVVARPPRVTVRPAAKCRWHGVRWRHARDQPSEPQDHHQASEHLFRTVHEIASAADGPCRRWRGAATASRVPGQ